MSTSPASIAKLFSGCENDFMLIVFYEFLFSLYNLLDWYYYHFYAREEDTEGMTFLHLEPYIS